MNSYYYSTISNVNQKIAVSTTTYRHSPIIASLRLGNFAEALDQGLEAAYRKAGPQMVSVTQDIDLLSP